MSAYDRLYGRLFRGKLFVVQIVRPNPAYTGFMAAIKEGIFDRATYFHGDTPLLAYQAALADYRSKIYYERV